MAALRRTRSPWRASVVAGLFLVAGCESTPPPAPVPAAPGHFDAADCTVTLTRAEDAARLLDAVEPGTTLCLSGDGLRNEDLVVRRSGTAERPIVISGDRAPVRSIMVVADFVVVQGLDTFEGEGIDLRGQGLVARDNVVLEAAQDGISCGEICADVLIADNTVLRADGSGIIVEGERITVRGNDVSGSVRVDANDADGIRFFGRDIRIVENTVTDIKDDGYGDAPPHTDCFQTYDNSRRPTVDVVIADNVCRNVDHQCLIATAEEAGMLGVVGQSRGIRFTGNLCAVEGSQAVLVQWFPDVAVRGNTFEGSRLDRAAYFLDGSTGAEFTGNSVSGGVRPYQLDEESEDGFTTDVTDD